MIALEDGIELFHGSYTEVPVVDLSRCVEGKDFGRGFYVTSSYGQASRFVSLSMRRAKRAGLVNRAQRSGYVSRYVFHANDDLLVRLYPNADVSWLHLVAANRDASLFPEVLESHKTCDIIGGKIANDRTAQTLQFYIAGAYGVPGDSSADDVAIRTLLPNRLKDQFCFRTEQSLACLEFVGSECVG